MRIGLIPMCGIVLGLLVTQPPQAESQDKSTTLRLRVHLNYSGSGTVDEKHKVYVVLWDSPAFLTGGEVMPLEIKSATSKQGIVTFADANKTPVYVSAVFDPKGEWDGQSGPPSEGSSLGIYSKEPGKPEPIEMTAGKTSEIDLAFDDSVKMQSGKPTR